MTERTKPSFDAILTIGLVLGLVVITYLVSRPASRLDRKLPLEEQIRISKALVKEYWTLARRGLTEDTSDRMRQVASHLVYKSPDLMDYSSTSRSFVLTKPALLAINVPPVWPPAPELVAERKARERKEQALRAAALLKERAAKAAAEKERLKAVAHDMDYFSGEPIGIAVSTVKLTKRINQSYGGYTYVRGTTRFVEVWVCAKNFGDRTIHVNPNDFTLSHPDGDTASYDVQTFSLGNSFDAVDLPPKGSTSGWLVFILEKSGEYTLHYNGFENSEDKPLVAPHG